MKNPPAIARVALFFCERWETDRGRGMSLRAWLDLAAELYR